MARYEKVFMLMVLFAFCFTPSAGHASGYLAGKVIDVFTGQPIPGAFVTSGNAAVSTDENGQFFTRTDGNKLSVRAHGYLKAELDANVNIFSTPPLIKLTPFTPKALYLTVYGIGDREIRNSAMKLIEETEINALVIDVKGDRGMIPYKSSIPLASEIGAQKIITVRDMDSLLKSLKAKGIYTIARIVTFKDNLLAQARPELAIRTGTGTVWKDREDLSWVDPSRKEVWDYNISIAIEAAKIGFDEVQFDYVRFPDTKGLEFSVPSTEENRTKFITGFLAEAKKRLTPYNVFLAADIFGYVCWNSNDTDIGQKIEAVSAVVDYVSPMLYPSGFQYGIPGYRNPVANPYEIVNLTLKRAMERTNLPPTRFRPWLQAFKDYAFDGRHFTAREISEQINASEESGANGWMLWNPRNTYSTGGLKRKDGKLGMRNRIPRESFVRKEEAKTSDALESPPGLTYND
jgi:hypothetical protein